jgi:hypothetical protein
MESCPFKNAAAPPCRFAVHPNMPNVHYCEICQRNYDIRSVGNRFELFPFLIVATVFVIFFNSVIQDDSANQETRQSMVQTSQLDETLKSDRF